MIDCGELSGKVDESDTYKGLIGIFLSVLKEKFFNQE